MSQDEFTITLGEIFENTPTIARKTWKNRPFTDIRDLHQKMVAVLNELSDREQIELMRSHPDLGSKAKMAEASVREQKGVGLDCLSPEEFQRFQYLNQTYREKFDFPFLIAVKKHTKASILEAFARRLNNDFSIEKQQALKEIAEIARFRLETAIEE